MTRKSVRWLVYACSAAAVLLAACSGVATEPASGADGPAAPAPSFAFLSQPEDALPAPESGADGARTFTLEELAAYNGKDGQPAYVAVNGVVIDVTNVPEWANGEHKSGLSAGCDLTEHITNESPHGLSVLSDLPVVGLLT